MRRINEFTLASWLKLDPLIHLYKEIRNDLLLNQYLNKRTESLREHLLSLKPYSQKNIAVVIAFEQPWALNFLLQMAQKNFSEFQILVCDNSRDSTKKLEIKNVCEKHNTPYFDLPKYQTKHVNRSHGVAMTWAYQNIIKHIEPNIFGFIDHDLIPIEPIQIETKIKKQVIYGQKNKGHWHYWSLWAGYCFYDYAQLKNKSLNFLYDFSRGLDTGGRNWDEIYKNYSEEQLEFAPNIKYQSNIESQTIEIVDRHWWHLSGISYNNNFDKRSHLFREISDALITGQSIKSFINS